MIELMDLAMEMSKDIQYLKAYIEALKNQKNTLDKVHGMLLFAPE